MKHRRILIVAALALAALVTSASAGTTELNGITYPENRRIKLALEATDAAPLATLKAEVLFKSGQADIEVKFSNLEPAVLFGGDITTYVLWAVPPAAKPANLGPVGSVETKGSLNCSTALKTFALIVTAEPLLTVTRPSELVVFTSNATTSKYARNAAFDFDALVVREQIAIQKTSIRGLSYKGDKPPILIQAQKSVELVERFGAEEFAPDAVAQAKTALAQATNLFLKDKSNKTGADYAQRAVELSSQALTNWVKDTEEKAEAARVAREQATKADLGESEEARRRLASDKRKLEAQRAQLETERAQLLTEQGKLINERAQLKADLDELSGRLSGALAAVSSTEQTARGYVVSFGDINFATGKADLADTARLNLAKLSGILLMMPDINVRIEGHTDSTGTAEINTKLSADRAEAVSAVLTSMGIAEGRIIAEGYGSARPIQPNDTSEGRAQNRRVELVLHEGTVAPPAD